MSERTVNNHVGFLQVGPGGICFAHGPYESQNCSQWPACVGAPVNNEYVRLALNQSAQDASRRLKMIRLERAVVEAAVKWRNEAIRNSPTYMYHLPAVVHAIDALIAARESDGKSVE